MAPSFTQGKAWRFASLGLIALPWFLRDQLAANLDHDTQAAQQVMDALKHEQQRLLTEHDQRDTSQRLRRIEIDVLRMAHAGSEQEANAAMAAAQVKAVHEEAEALKGAAAEFRGLLDTVGLEAEVRTKLEGSAQGAVAAADKLMQATDEAALEPLVPAFDQAAEHLGEAFEELHLVADRHRAGSAAWAERSRLAAWVLTAVGALMIGGWRKVLGEPEGSASA